MSLFKKHNEANIESTLTYASDKKVTEQPASYLMEFEAIINRNKLAKIDMAERLYAMGLSREAVNRILRL